jgi:cytochrome oxidase Cu insertion factor (SCO1/SenC/PrrC family)
VWWAFAFMPLPSAPPAWLTAARVACFGPMESGLPGPAGWMMLVLAPLSFLVTIVVLWGSELRGSLRHAVRRRLGQGVIAVLALATLVEGVWVGQRLQAAWVVSAWVPGPLDDATLPEAYPRQTAPAPAFTLIDQHGSAVSLVSFRGRPVVLTFVFAHCQTMCPYIVATLKRAAPERAEVLLVTLDPWRDTPSTLPSIARQWELPPAFHVLSSRTVTDVVRVAAVYGVSVERNERTGDIVHPGLVFLIDADGRLAYTFSNPPAAWVREGLQRLGRAHVLAR